MVSKTSYAKRLQVGAVAVINGRVVSVGFNGTPPGMDNNCEEVIQYSDDTVGLKTKQEVIHAEMNLIYKMARDGEAGYGSDLFVTHAPCFECSKAILSVGFKNVFYEEEYRDDTGVNLLRNNGINVEKV